MRLGAALTSTALDGSPMTGDSFARSASGIEEAGYSSIWTFDAVGRGFMLPDPLMALTAAAAATEHVELGTGIMQLPIRNVAEVAHRVFTLELLAPGRVLFGVGPGSTERDFEVFGGHPSNVTGSADAFASRFADFDEQWVELQRWIGDGKLGDRDLSPAPELLGGPSLMLAGWHGRWVERAAAEAAGWIASAVYADDEQLADGIARYRNAGGERAIVTNIQVGEDLAPTIDRIGRFAELGFDDAVVLDLTPSRERLDTIRASLPSEST
ncbi:MAG: LLM class flavin-dependent oxidoreductase [Acidimicrobiales bacterium]